MKIDTTTGAHDILRGPERNAYAPFFLQMTLIDYMLSMTEGDSLPPGPRSLINAAIDLAHRLDYILPNAVFTALSDLDRPEPFDTSAD